MMPQYLIGLAVVVTLAVDQMVFANAYAGDGKLIIMREVPYQVINGQRPTGRAHSIDTAPNTQVTSMTGTLSNSSGSTVTELTDKESAVIASGVNSNTAVVTSGLQNTSPYGGAVSGNITSALNSTLGPAGALGSMTSGIGTGVGGSVNRATDALSNTLSGAMFRTGSLK